MSSKRFRGFIFAAAILSALVFFVYSNTISSPFHYDDYINIVYNKSIQWVNVSFEDFQQLFSKKSSEAGFRPFSHLTFALNYYFGGLDVRGYHIVNILIHILAGYGFFLFFKTILDLPVNKNRYRGRSFAIALVASLLWISSPLHTQSVTYIVQRMAALAAMFYVYTLYFYLRGRAGGGSLRKKYYLTAIVCALLAFASKQNAYTLPMYLLLLEFIVFRGGDVKFLLKRNILIVIFILLLAFVWGFWYFYYATLVSQSGQWLIYQYKVRVLTGLRVIVFYVGQLLLPIPSKLSLIHDFQFSKSLFNPTSNIFAFTFVVSLIFFAIKYLKKYPLFSFFTLWFFGNLAIETFYPFLIMVFEHRLYLPSMGFFAIAALWLNTIVEYTNCRNLKWLPLSLIIVIIVSFSLNTYKRNLDWKSEYSLWSDVVDKNPNYVVGYIGLGAVYLRDNDYKKALPLYIRAKSLNPRNDKVRYGMGVAYFGLKEYNQAIKEFSYAASMVPNSKMRNSINSYFSEIAKNYYGQGKSDKALETLGVAFMYDSENPMLNELREKIKAGRLAK